MQSTASSSETEDAATTLQTDSLHSSSNAWRELRHPVQNEAFQQTKFPSFLSEMAREVSEYYRRQHFTICTPRQQELQVQTISQMNARFLQTWKQRRGRKGYECTFMNSVQPAQGPKAQREVLTHEAAVEIHRRSGKSLALMRTLEFVSHSDVAGQREDFEQARHHLLRRLNATKEEHRKYLQFA